MTASRLATGGSAIDRSRPIRFSFDGATVQGFTGDTIASALLAADVAVVGRSFKYHRPRGIWGAGVEEPNALVDISGPRATPNTRTTTEPARDGLVAKSVNATPNALADRNAFLDRFSRFIPAAFYYKTFMWPDWHRFEPRIRAMAGLGQVDKDWTSPGPADQINHHCDVLVIGAGPAGLAAARLAAGAGRSVMLVDDQQKPGGSLGHRAGEVDGKPAAVWVEETVAGLSAGGHLVLPSTTAFGIYDHNLVGLNQRHFDGRPDTLWRVRPRRIVLATGAIERPLPFANNDLPGILSADAALSYLRRHAVLAGRHIIVAANNDSAYEVAEAAAEAGADVTLVDIRRDGMPAAPAKVRMLKGRALTAAAGKLRVEGVMLDDGTRLDADCVLVSGGWTPTIHLFGQAKGKLAWSEARAAFLPGDPVEAIAVAGAAAGAVSLSEVFAGSQKAVASLGPTKAAVSRSSGTEATSGIVAAWPTPGSKGRIWIDYQNDVTVKDIELAARENFVSVEHLKRYTTLGMATDQGKTSNLPGLALMAGITGRTVPEVGTTTYRPPFTPVPLASFAGARGGELMAPVRRLPLESVHRASGAVFQEYGGWLRPAHYGGGGDTDRSIQDEARRARQSVALFDGSTLGKIEVIGPKAAAFVDFVYYNTMSTLKPGRCRYGFMLSENGVVFDDGVLVRLDEHRFVVSCSSSHVAAVHARLEEWRQDRFGRGAVYIHNATAEMATVTVSGPNARKLLETVDLGLSLEDGELPHMAVGQGSYDGDEVRITRVSFTGDRSYEISIRADRAEPLWARLRDAGQAFDAVVIGLEALMILRAEKGFIVIGKDTDGTTLPHDLGVEGPRAKRQTEFVGRRSLFTEEASRGDRMQLVGLAVPSGEAPLPTGAHGIKRSGGKLRSQGFVTSSYRSPTLGRPVALGLIERGAARHGETIEIQHLGKAMTATITSPCAFDPAGDRLNA
ncbi:MULTISPECIES: sarcosine oxidase subunit alpha family protein [unclassified Mesorhizobium]|uniref:sarcosine oxidase subunit alpha family protein n=1 Tax=unclassified Mesorhizobium TaxID=325217 RepID=UPI001127D746|nr:MULTISPECIES: sarcosine oxidase subunit alpha family protein [unclassified Mesorhizobium]MCA0024854.1 sarcosine oxidase subunit alpha family protein [Mesorhizobium sp. B263B1A]TPK00282.1 sarcosine oxidase subunit alpha family protein [Mesorhizobium sp. B2-5-12]TPK27754.1 sarcosine oxidase subunit alpha family protein [Mesorhizobium sp. B2-5-6]TPM01717.1 sarcosine oxidase subunit alpha family protein [Mesorhizobium sp. B2-3-8]TPM12367.1 sarcosine oxidase subunit alpha family protein [Mesorhi